MLWTEIRKWAKDHGYETIKEKEGEITRYYWAKLDAPDASGVSKSVSKLAFDIYNHMTDNKWIDHQKQYQENLELKNVEISDY